MSLISRVLGIALLLNIALSVRSLELPKVEYELETLDNGLTVIYAPLKTAPVVHVRVLYHVGSRDEKADRQGFAHMFEHMMFRGSQHVQNEEHMRRINGVGGESNAFTSFDQTVYVNTIPANHLEMALFLEADRMASFMVTDEHLKTERQVVAEEWRMRYANQPYGPLWADFARTAFTTHSYRWTPIGDMDQLKQSTTAELQEFWNTYYVPNNAVLVVAGDIDVPATKQWVRKYFGYIPRGPEIKRLAEKEPEQTEARRLEVYKRSVPIVRIMGGYKTQSYEHPDHYALDLLSIALGGGRSSRLDQKLVNSDNPLCLNADAGNQQLQDAGMFIVSASVKPGKDYKQVESELASIVAEVAQNGTTQEELDKARKQILSSLIESRETCESVADLLGDQQLFAGDVSRVNTQWNSYSAVTLDDIKRVASTYLQPQRQTTVVYLPDPLGKNSNPAQQEEAARKAAEAAKAEVVKSTTTVEPRKVEFPSGYPDKAPQADANLTATFKKGDDASVNGVKVIVLSDHRLPLVNWSLIMRSGGHAEPADKLGLAGLTASMMRRGSAGIRFLDFSEDLESRGISIEASDGGDHTRIGGSCTTDQLDYAFEKMRDVLLKPNFPEDEFAKLKQQTVGGLIQGLANPSTVAQREMRSALWGDTPLGRNDTPATVQAIKLEDIKDWYGKVYRPNDAILIISGDITVEKGRELAARLLDGWQAAESLPRVQINLPEPATSRKIILVDNPDGKQAVVRFSQPSYTLHSDEKYPGSVVGRILSDGIESRLNRYVRAQKGLTYGCGAYFMPTRLAGSFAGSVETKPETTVDAIQAMWKVLNDTKSQTAAPEELADGQRRVTGGMVMEMQTIGQQAARRVDVELNGYPLDYFDTYASKINAVSADQVREVLAKYFDENRSTIVVVAPAAQVLEQLKTLGEVEVRPMPLKRQTTAPATQPGEMLKKEAA